MNRRDFLKTGASASAFLLATPAWCAENQNLSADPGEILKEAPGRIAKCRMGEGTVVARNAKGKPVRGAKVTIEQLRHDFLFGSNLFQFGHCGTPEQEEQYRQRFTALFNYCTLGFYWAGFEPERGKPNYDYIDKVVEWARAQQVTCKGHPLVWDHPASSPRWLPDDQQEIAKLSDARVQEIVARYKGRIDVWDVVNEATHLPQGVNQTKMAKWGAALGSAPYVAHPLRIARAANPQARLVVNDYRTDPPYLQLLEQVTAQGKSLFDIVGIQSHMHDAVWPTNKVWEICDTYQRLGLPIHFTETTILSGSRQGPGENWNKTDPEAEAKQAEQTAALYTTLFSHPAVQAVTWWDFSDYHAWQGAPAGWVRDDMSPKPVYHRLKDLVRKQWWTKTTGVTDKEGRFSTRAFFGTYKITVQTEHTRAITLTSSQEVQWQRGQTNQFEFRI